MGKFCSGNQTILMRCIYSASLLVKRDEPSGGVELIKKAIGLNPQVPEAQNNLGNALRDLKRSAEALASYDKAIALKPDFAEVYNNRGSALMNIKRPEEALASYDKAIALKPDFAKAYNSRGNTLNALKRHEEALTSYDKAIALKPDYAEAHNNRGSALMDLKRPAEALASYDRAIALEPDFAWAHNNRGNALMDLKRPEEALASYERALALRPDYVDALTNRGGALRQLKRLEEALAAYDRALAFMPDLSIAWNNRGNVLQDLHRPEEALASYDRALAFLPDYAEALNHRGNVLRVLKRPEEALASYRRALALRPDLADALASLGDTLLELLRPTEAAVAFARLLEANPDRDYARGNLLHARMQCCDWTAFHSEAAAVERDVKAGRRSAAPFGFQAVSQSPESLYLCSKTYAADKYPSRSPLWSGERYANRRIRLGYLAGEFRTHATSILMAGLFECHDRNRFELFAFDNGFDDASPMRRRVEKSFDSFIDISRLSDLDAARLVRSRQIDILVNLNGYCGLSRTGVFAYRPCPVQVNYLGFPGTIGADYIDYIVADKTVIREDEHRYYCEKVVSLPDSYQVNDSRRAIAEGPRPGSKRGCPRRVSSSAVSTTTTS